MQPDLNKITVRKTDIRMRDCKACGTKTAHIGDKDGTKTVAGFTGKESSPFSLCLQCFVDVNNVREWSRWIDPFTGNTLSQPRAQGGKLGSR